MKHGKLKIGVAVSAAVAAMAVSSVAQATEVTVGGHVNRMIRFADDGTNTDTQFLDNGANASRLNFAVETEFAGWNVEAYSEFRWNSNDSASESLETVDDDYDFSPFSGDSGLETAYLDIRFSSEWGTFSMGRGDGAARFTQRQDLSGTELADNFDNRRIAAVEWTADLGGGQEGIGVSIGDVFQTYEGTRDDRIRYDTPTIAGFTLSGSAASGRNVEAGLTWDSATAEYLGYGDDDIRIIAAIGYTTKTDVSDLDQVGLLSDSSAEIDEQIAASASVLLPMGLNLTVGYGDRSYVDDGADLRDNDAVYIKPGWRFGNHAVSFSWWESSDIGDAGTDLGLGVGANVDGTAYSLAYQWTGGEGVDVYASVSQQEADTNGPISDVDIEDITVFMAGARVSF